MTKQDLMTIICEVMSEYLPKTKSTERKECASAISDELEHNGFDFEADYSDDDEEKDDVKELDF